MIVVRAYTFIVIGGVMAEVDMQGMLESYREEFADVLEAAVKAVAPDVAVDRRALFEAFSDAMQARQARWMPLADEFVGRG
jgi:hypothetical protein